MEDTEKTSTKSKPHHTVSSFPGERCQEMAEMMKSLCGRDKGPFEQNPSRSMSKYSSAYDWD